MQVLVCVCLFFFFFLFFSFFFFFCDKKYAFSMLDLCRKQLKKQEENGHGKNCMGLFILFTRKLKIYKELKLALRTNQ